MMFLWIPFLLLVPLAIFWMARPGYGHGCGYAMHPTHGAAPGSADEEPISIARKRLARGEITPAEFDEIRRALG
jgi:hypothetical protein